MNDKLPSSLFWRLTTIGAVAFLALTFARLLRSRSVEAIRKRAAEMDQAGADYRFVELPGARVTENIHDGAILRLLVIADGTQVKIEVSPVLRGVVHEPSTIPVTEAVEEAFGFAETSVVSFEDLFAGK